MSSRSQASFQSAWSSSSRSPRRTKDMFISRTSLVVCLLLVPLGAALGAQQDLVPTAPDPICERLLSSGAFSALLSTEACSSDPLRLAWRESCESAYSIDHAASTPTFIVGSSCVYDAERRACELSSTRFACPAAPGSMEASALQVNSSARALGALEEPRQNSGGRKLQSD
eukprot:619319-Pleurochrysis_carterae.AAC.2